VRLTTAAKSGPIYREMARRAVSLIPRVSTMVFEGAGHCVAQEVPERVVEAVREFTR
jgi:pimeloyl-ACP methyl ester carboxylesterase